MNKNAIKIYSFVCNLNYKVHSNVIFAKTLYFHKTELKLKMLLKNTSWNFLMLLKTYRETSKWKQVCFVWWWKLFMNFIKFHRYRSIWTNIKFTILFYIPWTANNAGWSICELEDFVTYTLVAHRLPMIAPRCLKFHYYKLIEEKIRTIFGVSLNESHLVE